MYNMTKKRGAKNVFIVIIHTKEPKDPKTGKVNVVERCEFVDALKPKHDREATVIVDYLNEKVVKNRYDEGSYQEFIWYFHKNYPQQMHELAEEYKSVRGKADGTDSSAS